MVASSVLLLRIWECIAISTPYAWSIFCLKCKEINDFSSTKGIDSTPIESATSYLPSVPFMLVHLRLLLPDGKFVKGPVHVIIRSKRETGYLWERLCDTWSSDIVHLSNFQYYHLRKTLLLCWGLLSFEGVRDEHLEYGDGWLRKEL
jgi:hypothetical protein